MDNIFVPTANAYAVTLIESKLGLPGTAVVVPFEPMPKPKARERYCFENVRDMVREHGGEILCGWVVWQHGEFFVEAEHHAVWQKPSGQLACVTPQTPPEKALTFIPDPSAVYDFDTRLLTKNIRVALINDSRLEKAFKLLDRQTDLLNAGQRRDSNSVLLAGDDVYLYDALNMQKTTLLMQVMMSNGSSPHPHDLTKNVGRNDPCPCASGKKFKKCHGA